MRSWRNNEDQIELDALLGPFQFRCGKGAHARQLARKKHLGKFLLDNSTEALESSSLEFLELGLGVHCTPSQDELVFLMIGHSRPANGRPHVRLLGLSLSRD
jgi:hypothetical protein